MTDKPRTWNDVTRSTEAEFQSFRKGLDRLLLTPERFNTFLATMQIKDKPMADPQWNIKARELYCQICKLYFLSDKAAPKCDVCETILITVVRSVLTGEVITGARDADPV